MVDGDKMSKSKGNVVDPVEPIKEFGPDAVRYFLLREISLGSDGNYSRKGLIRRVNTDLANDLGNLQYRTVSMIEKYHGGVVHKTVVDNESIGFLGNWLCYSGDYRFMIACHQRRD